jgi:hypothetical protein
MAHYTQQPRPHLTWQLLRTAMVILPVGLAAGCGQAEGIRQYRVPKPEVVYSQNHVDRSSDNVPTVQYALPRGWSEQPSEMFSQLTLGLEQDGRSAQITVSQLQGDGGGVLPNINRWYQQAGMPEITAADLKTQTETLVVDGVSGTYVEACGTSDADGGKAVVGWIGLQDAGSWFVKISGDATLVREQREAFRNFLRTLRFVVP